MMPLPALFHITDRTLKQDLRGGMVIVRDYDHPQREAYARDIIRRCGAKRVMVAGDVRLAQKIGAAGLHVPEWQLKRLPLRIFAPKGWMVTAACHNVRALKLAARHPLVRAVLLSPLFAVEGKRPLGLVRFGLLARQSLRPVIALGGLKRGGLPKVQGWGASGIAMRSSWLGQV